MAKVTPLNGLIILNRSAESKALDKSALGPEVASIPEPIYRYLQSMPEFQWVLEDGGAAEFCRLNPQFYPKNRVKLTLEETLKLPLKNKDNWFFDQKHKDPRKW